MDHRTISYGCGNQSRPRAAARQHIEIEFPANPCDSAARFALRAGPSSPIHFVNSEQLVRLVAEAGEELVGLCYFGDQPSREHIETQLALKGSTQRPISNAVVRFTFFFQTKAAGSETLDSPCSASTKKPANRHRNDRELY